MKKHRFAKGYAALIGANGNLDLPANLRREMRLKKGDKITLRIKPNGKLELESTYTVAKQCEGIFAHIAPGKSLAQELIEERRAEWLKHTT